MSASTFNTLTPPKGVNYSTEIICAFGLHAKYEEENPEDGSSLKTETKNKKINFYFSNIRSYTIKNHNWEES